MLDPWPQQRILTAGAHLLLPLLFGGLIYVFFRPATLVGQGWALLSGTNPVAMPQGMLRMAVNVLPDMAWSYSLAYFLFLFSAPAAKNILIYAAIIGVIVSISECIQLILPAYFTFDFLDLVAGWIAVYLALYFYKRQNK